MYYPNYLDFEHENELRAWSLSRGQIPQYPIFANVEQYFLYHIIIAHTFLIFFISDPLLALTNYTTPTTYYLFVQFSALQFHSLIHYVVFLVKSLSNLRSKSIKKVSKSVSKHHYNYTLKTTMQKICIKHKEKYIYTTRTQQLILSPHTLKKPYTTPRASTQQRGCGFSIRPATPLKYFCIYLL